MIKSRIQIKHVVVAMAALVPMIAFSQASESTIEVKSSVAEISVSNPQQSSGENNTNSGFSKNSEFQTLPNVATNLDVEVQTRFNEIRSELLDERASYIDLWLTVIGLFLGLFAVVVPIAGIMGFRRFREIEKEAKTIAKTAATAADNATVAAENAAAAAENAEHHLQEIRKKSDTATDLLKGMHADSADENPTEATQTVKNIQDDPYPSQIDKAVADAVFLQQQGKNEDAIKKWHAIAEVTEGSDNALAAQAWVSIGFLSSVENVTKKLYSYDRAIQLKPDHARAYYNRGNAKGRLGRLEDAIADYDKAIQLKPDHVKAYYNRGNTKRRLGRPDDAITDYDRAIQLKPDHARAYSNRGISKSDVGRPDDAIADYDKAIQLEPDHAKAYYNRGNAKGRLGRPDDAITDYDKAIQLKPDYTEAYTNRGNTKGRLGRPDDAITDYDKAIQLEPDHAKAYYNRGNAKRRLGRLEDAIADYDKAIQLEPDYAKAYYNRGNLKRRLGRPDDAIVDHDKAIQLEPDYAKAYYNRGISKSELGFKVEAKSDFESARELAQNSDNVDLIDLVEKNLHRLSAINSD